MTSILSVENLDIFYDKFHAVKNISLSLNQKDIVVICGPSGSGKSTLIRSIAGLEKYKTGKILVNNEVITDKVVMKKNIFGMVFQQFNLFPHLTILENITLKPYQYTWLNSFAKLTDIEKNFEIDYWGISNKNLQKEIIKDSKTRDLDKNICIFGDAYTKDFLDNTNFSCFKNYSEIDAQENRPFYAYKNVRNVKRSDPKDCELIWNEGYKYTFYKKKISTATLWFCD